MMSAPSASKSRHRASASLNPCTARASVRAKIKMSRSRLAEAMQKPCMANMVPGGKTPVLPPKALQQIGYKLTLYPVALLTSAIAAMQTALAALRPESGNSLPPGISFAELQKVVGFPEYWTQETKYQSESDLFALRQRDQTLRMSQWSVSCRCSRQL